MFFDDHPVFLTTSRTRSDRKRLNLRHEAIITANRDIIEGAHVLDLASHDGRWTFAALEAGAAHVTGIEAREHLVANARQTLADEGIDESRYTFKSGDMFRVLADEEFKVDVVMNLGFLYHTLRYNELFHRMGETGASHLIIDSTVSRERRKPTIELRHDNVKNDSSAVTDEFAPRREVLVGWPSASAIELLATSYGFAVTRRYNWASLLKAHEELEGNESVRDYRLGNRVTLRAERRAATPESAPPAPAVDQSIA